MVFKFAMEDKELIKNLPEDLFNELLNYNSAIPDELHDMLNKFNPEWRKLRSDRENRSWTLLSRIYMRRAKYDKLFDKIRMDAQLQDEIDFIIRYPQYKCLIKFIAYELNNDLEDLGSYIPVPLDDFLDLIEDQDVTKDDKVKEKYNIPKD
ncbi:hypothetical protein BGI41_01515 [Methanobrevibacter sp. 87.7]|uniref:hypothetical protein n=1 Tax=Methanobrevibacter sp. 87.7 TaxID=387957 RepID=UPI000B51483C|nr:hypothetical protein [Methanobrevibacter sp. 87.7]OWT33613.1 hypothetical protein BGI41_01515 [Methanobrevibacter sp. 87.7]